LMAMSVISLLSGLFFYVMQKREVEQWIGNQERAVSELSPAERDALTTDDGANWGDRKAEAHFGVLLVLILNVGLALAYLGTWFWAKRNALHASVAALLLCIAVIVGDAAYDPSTLKNGWLVRILFIVALCKAIAAAREEQKLQAHMPRAKLA
jgi:hypothetical protein